MRAKRRAVVVCDLSEHGGYCSIYVLFVMLSIQEQDHDDSAKGRLKANAITVVMVLGGGGSS